MNIKETQLQEIERIKKEKSSLDILADIYMYAVLGENISNDDLLRFQWYGLTLQKEDNSNLLFTLKIKIVNAKLTIEQIEILLKISKEFADNSFRFVTRQNIEFDNIKIYDIPAIFNLLNKVNLHSIFASGHVPTNIMCCPINGYNKDQVVDVSDIVLKLNDDFEGNKNFSNLPNELKIMVDGCGCVGQNCDDNDLFFKAIKSSNGKIQFKVNISGVKQLETIGYIAPSQVIPLAKAVAKIYRDFGYRGKKKQSKLAYLVDDWGIDEFIHIIQSELAFRIKDTYDFIDTKKDFENYNGIFESNKKDFSFLGFELKDKNINSNGLENLYILLKKYNATEIKITPKENIIILDVPSNNAISLEKELKKNF
ncbi:sulfite reductase [Arcobacter sp. CECT 8985]|uniref:sulfite reductase n=1 Tax=Arcobacter sp. CECT 8985 TaxID=1935424 RepID=UPI00100C2D92|nr:sulfite reductase [Arcobacter sp. CECT 8985]RXJ84585.1 sulfite reductase [Arcobacter sp. CECT 8985]